MSFQGANLKHQNYSLISAPNSFQSSKKEGYESLMHFGKLAQTNNTMIVPAQLGDVATLVSTAMSTMDQFKTNKDNN